MAKRSAPAAKSRNKGAASVAKARKGSGSSGGSRGTGGGNTRGTGNSRGRPNVAKAGNTNSRATYASIAVLVVLAIVVFGGIFYFSDGSTSSNAIPVTQASAQYPTTVQGGVIVAGNPTAPKTLEVYEDILCPACQAFEQQDGPKINAALSGGQLQVKYHMVNLLEQSSSPPGYSTDGGNAVICAAENNAFPTIHTSLYGAQPQEGAAGFTTEQLVQLGQGAGAGPGYAGCVQGGTHKAAIAANYQQAATNPALQTSSGGFGTPTIVGNGQKLEAGTPQLETFLQG